MNAYELADELDRIVKVSMPLHYITESANMLRQQADRIERKRELIREQTALLVKQNNRIAELEKSHIELERGIVADLNQRQSAEPFIWLKQDFDGEWIEVHPNKGIPLYTTPQIKELSDAEIRTIQDMCHLKNVGYNTFIMRFARAILKKASEK